MIPIVHEAVQTTELEEPQTLGNHRAGLIVGVIAFAGLMGTLMQSLIVPILGELPAMLGTSATATSWLVTSLLVSGAVSNVVFGRFGDMYGKRRMIIVCLSCLLVGSILGSITSSIALLIVARVLQGVTMAVIPLGISALGDLLEGQALVKGIALVSAMVGIGGSLGFAASAAAAQFLPWHALFAVSAVLAALALLLVIVFLPRTPATMTSRPDIPGIIGLTVGIVALLLAISEGSTWGWTSAATLGLLLGAVIVFVLWGLHELRTTAPLVDLRTTARRPVLFTNLATIMVGFGMYGVILSVPQLVQLPAETGFGLGQPVIVAGLVVAPGAVVSLLMPSVAAWITERWGAKTTMITGALVMAIGYIQMFVVHSELWELALGAGLISCGVSFCFGAAPTLIMRFVPHTETGQANGINNLARSLGTSTSSAVTAAILAGLTIPGVAGRASVPSESAFTTVFAIAAVAALCICALTLLVTDRRSRA